MDLFDIMPSYMWYMGYGMIIMAVYLLLAIYFIPLLQTVVQYQNKIWLNNVLSRTKGISPEAQQSIIEAAQPETKAPLYKLTKFSYFVGGIIAAIAGVLVIALQEADEDVVKNIIYIPLILGVVSMLLYKNNYPNSKLWKETAGFFGVLGVCVTIPGMFAIYEWDWMRSDILVYFVLILALAVVHILESTVASYLYMLGVAAGSSILWANVEADWMAFFKSFIWFFALAPLVFWMPRLKSAKESGPKEIAFGLLFFFMLIVVTAMNLKGLAALGLTILIPIMYMFSKIHFKQEGWFLTKPIQTLIILGTYIGIYMFSSTDALGGYPSFGRQFEDFYFYKLVDYLVILAMGFGAVMMYRDNFEEDTSKINLVVLALPVVAYIASFLSDYYVDYLFIPVMVYFGWTYLDNGLNNKNIFAILLGMGSILSILPTIYNKLPWDIKGEATTIGFFLILYGGAMVAATMYLKGRWSVTDEVDDTPKPLPSSNDVLDNELE